MDQSTPQPLLLRASEVAALLGLSKSKVYELIASGQLPRFPLGSTKTVRVSRAALERWIADRDRESAQS